MTLMRVELSAIGRTREEVLDELERIQRLVLTEAGGEPWIAMTDDVVKLGLDGRPVLDPDSFFFKGDIELRYLGPNPIATGKEVYRDGFRPQGDDDAG